MGDISIKGRSPLVKGGRVGLRFGGPPSRSDKASRKEDISHQRKLQREKRKKEAHAYWEKQDVRDVKGKVIPVAGKPHTTRAGRMAERRRGYLRDTKKFEDAARKQSESRNRRTHLGEIRLKKKGGKV